MYLTFSFFSVQSLFFLTYQSFLFYFPLPSFLGIPSSFAIPPPPFLRANPSPNTFPFSFLLILTLSYLPILQTRYFSFLLFASHISPTILGHIHPSTYLTFPCSLPLPLLILHPLLNSSFLPPSHPSCFSHDPRALACPNNHS